MSNAEKIELGVLVFSAIGLGVTAVSVYLTARQNAESARIARQDSAISTYLDLHERMQETLYVLLESDRDVLKEIDIEKLKVHRFRFFRLFDIFAHLHEVRHALNECDVSYWVRSEARIRRVMAKPAARVLWQRQISKNPTLFSSDFAAFMNESVAGGVETGNKQLDDDSNGNDVIAQEAM